MKMEYVSGHLVLQAVKNKNLFPAKEDLLGVFDSSYFTCKCRNKGFEKDSGSILDLSWIEIQQFRQTEGSLNWWRTHVVYILLTGCCFFRFFFKSLNSLAADHFLV